MGKRKLIFLDIDGTLVPAGSNVPPDSALEALEAARRKGHGLFLCTGRNLAMLSPLLKYNFDGAVAGAGSYVFCGDEVLYDHPMTNLQRDIALTALHKHGVFCTLEAKDATYGDENLGDFLSGTSSRPGNSEIERWRRALAEDLGILPMSAYDGRPVYKVVFMCGREEQLLEARGLLEREFNFCYQSLPVHACVNGEMIGRDFDKGRGVEIICRHLGVPVEDSVGFGDSMNDLEMIDTVGVSVCMSNGSPALMERSDLVCPSVEDDGLARAFAQLGLV